jgi:hypothetical protein
MVVFGLVVLCTCSSWHCCCKRALVSTEVVPVCCCASRTFFADSAAELAVLYSLSLQAQLSATGSNVPPAHSAGTVRRVGY